MRCVDESGSVGVRALRGPAGSLIEAFSNGPRVNDYGMTGAAGRLFRRAVTTNLLGSCPWTVADGPSWLRRVQRDGKEGNRLSVYAPLLRQ